MKQLINYILLGFLLVFASCSTYESFTIDVLAPAKYTIAPEITSVVLVNNSIPYRDTTKNTVQVNGKKRTMQSVWQDDFAEIALQSLNQELLLREFYDTVYYHSQTLKTDASYPYRALNWLQVDSICNIYGAEGIISFEANRYATTVKAEPQYDGGFYATMDVEGAILWRGYNNIDRTALYKEVQKDTISWQAYGSTLERTVRDLPDLKEAYVSLAEYQGMQAVNHTTPLWESEQRGLYKSGNYQFLQAAEFVRKKQYGEAIKLWKYIYDNANSKYKARSSYNLAVASEILGDFESAKYWLKISNDIYISKEGNVNKEEFLRSQEYAKILRARLETINKLKEQVGGFE
ncbi:DUF6340 family protein [Saccharicrinis aurantiacus]|uniref:DUF6340 family protein n=1 Tax=Saccharicrinis aurantiacus TaxID=1849719 RepID=UPI00094FD6B5|nr:DUF6340 family protein [Saccharicrinis aurantiacus]